MDPKWDGPFLLEWKESVGGAEGEGGERDRRSSRVKGQKVKEEIK